MGKWRVIGILALAFSAAGFLQFGNVTEASGESAGKVSSGSFSVLTYNVAGLPQGISKSNPIIYMAKISPRLNAFDLVLAQEDFSYHDDLRSLVDHSYVSGPGTAGSLGDGLARFSRFAFTEVEHVSWDKCHGKLFYSNDCLTKKGFSMAVHEISAGVFVDVYNLHLDAGGSSGDIETRAANIEQLMDYMSKRSAGRAIIAGGDWNLNRKRPRDLELLQKILDEQGLTDSCRYLDCGVERIDRVLFRSSDSIGLTPVAYKVEVERFSTKNKRPLSDHDAVSVIFKWQLTASK